MATGAPLAKTGFESSEGYTGNDLMYEAALSDFGWVSGWFHAQGGGPGNPVDQNPWSVTADDGTAAEGDQYYRQHRFEAPANWPNAAAATDASTIAMHRLFPEQAGRLYLRFRVRVDTIRAAPQWFKNFCGFYLLGNLQEGNPGTGVALPAGVSTGPWVRFDRNGSLGVNQLGVWSVLPHKWDGTGALPSAVNGWVTLEADVDIPSQTYELIYGGTSLGIFRFSSEDVDSLNGLRLQGPAAHDGNDSQPPDPINWRNGASFDDIFIGTSRATGTDCDTSVLPSGSRALSATAGEPASPSSVNYVIYNDSAVAHDYAIEPVLSDGTPTNYEWLSLSKSSVTLAAGASDSFTAAVDPLAPDPDLPGGIYTAYIKITDLTANCSDPEAPTEWIRSLVLTVSDWEVAPTILQSGYYHDELPLHLPEPIVYTVRNVGLASINYTAAESDIFGNALNYTWLTLNKAGGTVAPGSSDAVTVTIDPLAVGYGRNTGYVKFTRGAFTEIRKISFFRSGFGFVQIIEYQGDVDPTSADSAGPGVRFSPGATTVQGQVESAASSVAARGASDGRAYRINDSDALKTVFGAVREDNSPIQIDRLVGGTVLARLRVLEPASDPTTSGTLFVFSPFLASAGLYGGSDSYIREVTREVHKPLPAGDGEWHIVRMTAFGSVDETRYFRVYLDEDPTPVLEITPETGGNTLVSNVGDGPGGATFGFGVGSVFGTIDVAFDWVTATNVAAFPPGDEIEVLGRSLIPKTCGDPYADFDGDGDVDQEDFALLQRCYTYGISSPVEMDDPVCVCADRNRDQVVDAADLTAFLKCGSGPSVPFDLACDD